MTVETECLLHQQPGRQERSHVTVAQELQQLSILLHEPVQGHQQPSVHALLPAIVTLAQVQGLLAYTSV